MQSESKRQLLVFIDELKLPISPEDVYARLQQMTDEDVAILLPSFKYIIDYQNKLSKEAVSIDPANYALAESKYQKELQKLHEEFLNKLEQVQTNTDEDMNKIEEETNENILNLLEKEDKDLKEIEDEYLSLASK